MRTTRQKFNLILFAFVAILFGSTSVHADIIKGRVVDAETKEGLPEASVRIMEMFSDYGYNAISTTTDSLGRFTAFASRRASVEFSMLGYYTKTKTVLAFSDSRKDTIDVGTIELSMSPQMLKMVEVTGQARRFTVRGDTIVFHPEAFHLQEGTRLDELISQLPGVHIDDNGLMSWNGKPIRLTMDGEGILGSDQLMKELPVEAVQNIKAYNKASEFAERTKKDDGKQDLVLDLTIKPGFLDRLYGDVKVGYYTPKYYEGELRMNRLSKTDPVMSFLQANNIYNYRRRNMKRNLSTPDNGFRKEQRGSASYQHKWTKKEGTQEMRSQYSFIGSIYHDDKTMNEREKTENYFPNTTASIYTSDSYRRQHKLNPSINGELHWAKDSLNTYSLFLTADHTRHRSNNRTLAEQSEQPDAKLKDGGYVPVLSQNIENRNEGRSTQFNPSATWVHYVNDGALGANIRLRYSNDKEDSHTNRIVTSHQHSVASTQLNQFSTTTASTLSVEAEAYHDRWLTKKWLLQMKYSYHYDNNRRDCDFTTDGEADAANSYRNRLSANSHSIIIGQTINLAPFQLMPSVTAKWLSEKQDYQRGGLDTAAVRNSLLIDPSLRATLKVTKTIGFELNYSFTTSRPNILQTIGYSDMTNPLFIIEGNPSLKDSHVHDVSLSYNMVLASSQSNISVSVGHHNSDRDVISALSYNPSTAVYVSRPENVKGNYSWRFRLNIDQGIGDFFRVINDMYLNSSQHYGYLTLMPTQNERTVNRQTDLNPRDRLTISYNRGQIKASAYAEIDVNRIRFNASPEQNTNLQNNLFGIEAQATIGSFIFETSLVEHVRRGYAAQSMNTNRLLWDGSLTWKLWKNKARLKMQFQDILNNEDGYFTTQSAYQRTTTWTDFRHHYIGISFTYHLDAKKKD